MTYLIAALLGVVQGLTEFLPVSSTAHLLVGGRLARFDDPAFVVMIQLGSVLALMWLYRTKILAVATRWPTDPDARRFALMLLVGMVPAVIAGALLGGFVQRVLFHSPTVIAAALVAGGVVMLAVERFRPTPTVTDAERTPLARALGVGLCQMLALVPGVSRSGATIVGGLLMGLDRAAAAEFSFFLAIPTMMAAFVYSLVNVWDQLAADRVAEIAVGFVFAFAAAMAIVRPFLRFVARSGFAPFAWYRIAAGTAMFMAIAGGWL